MRGASHKLIGYDLRASLGDPIQGRIPGEILKGQNRYAFHRIA
jgi:hypothetical protein